MRLKKQIEVSIVLDNHSSTFQIGTPYVNSEPCIKINHELLHYFYTIAIYFQIRRFQIVHY